MNVIFQAISQLTGGLISDTTTLIVGILSITFICMALERLRDFIENTAAENQYYSASKKVGMTDVDIQEEKDAMRREYAKERYRRRL